jgi:hypothetical protein
LDDNSKQGRLCNLFYSFDRDVVLSEEVWSFAVARQALSQLSATNNTNFDYMYQLPVDPYCLYPIEIKDYPNEPFIIEGRVLYTNLDAVTLRYTAQITDPTQFPALFSLALAYKIASDLAMSMEGKQNRFGEMESMYQRMVIKAQGIDIGGRSTPIIPSELWTDARFS